MLYRLKQLALHVIMLLSAVLLVVILVLNIRAVRSEREAIQHIIDNYEPAIGTINYARVKEIYRHARRRRTTYAPDVEFRYGVDGRVRRSNRYTVGLGSTQDKHAVQLLIANLTPGSQWEIYYDPQRPEDAVLVMPTIEMHKTTSWQIILVCVIVVLYFVLMYIIVLRDARPKASAHV